MEIQFEGTLTEQQYTTAYRQAVGAQLRPMVYLIGLIPGVAVLAFWFLTRLRDTGLSYESLLPMIIFPFILLLIFGYMYFMGARQAWTQQPPSVRAHTQGSVTGEGVHWNSDVGETRFKWAAFTRYKELKDVLLLYQGAAFTILPRAFFASDADWEAAQALVRENIPM